MPKFKVIVDEQVEYEVFVDAKDKDAAEVKAKHAVLRMGPLQRARATVGVSELNVDYCAEWSA